jgi:hypothetical protein
MYRRHQSCFARAATATTYRRAVGTLLRIAAVAAVLGTPALLGISAQAHAAPVQILFDCVDESGNRLPGDATVSFYYQAGTWSEATPFVLAAEEGDAAYVTFTCYGRSVTMMGKHVTPSVAVELVATGPFGTDYRDGGEPVPGMLSMIAIFRPLSVKVVGMDSNGAETSQLATVRVGDGPAITQMTPYQVTACNGAMLSVSWEGKRGAGPYTFWLAEGSSFMCDFLGRSRDWSQATVASPGTQEIVLVVPATSGSTDTSSKTSGSKGGGKKR